MKKKLFYLISSSFLICLALGIWAFWWEPTSLFNEDHSLEIPNWPSSCNGIRVAVLADLHVGSPFNQLEKLDRIVSTANAAKPDLILLAGDYVIHDVLGGRFTEPERIANSLAKLEAPMGVFAVLGNHDWWYDAERIQRSLLRAGIQVLENASIAVRSGKCRFWLVGIGDYWEGDHDLDKSLKGIPKEDPVLAFTHNPDLFPDIPPNVSLTVAGHTHGGQVYIPFIGRPIVPSEYGEQYAIGHIIEEGRHLFVTPGLGTSILPVRFLVPPEISVLVIRAV